MTSPPFARVLVEACVTSAAEAAACFAAGASRVELCRRLDVGGLTPDGADVREARALAGGPVFAMARSREGSFRVAPAELAALIETVSTLTRAGADGIVVGVLDARGRVDAAALRDLVAAADGRPVTFHRAFDELDDPLTGLETLLRCGVHRVLTSGGASQAWEGRSMLRALVSVAGGSLTVLAGGRVRADHVARLIEETGVTEVHARASAVPGLVGALGRERRT
ncbi:MAG: copper homeostasis protein CutC [Gemmatimonadetes bacterium]|nr:copper homeostasis protein CutC [Gemmatimonadota bacterium]